MLFGRTDRQNIYISIVQYNFSLKCLFVWKYCYLFCWSHRVRDSMAVVLTATHIQSAANVFELNMRSMYSIQRYIGKALGDLRQFFLRIPLLWSPLFDWNIDEIDVQFSLPQLYKLSCNKWLFVVSNLSYNYIFIVNIALHFLIVLE